LAVALLVLRARRGSSFGTGLLVGVAVCGVVGLAVPMAPQMVINERQFDQVSVLPVYQLADLQGRAGMQILRFATNVSGCGEVAVGFPNPYVADPPAAQGARVATTNDALRFYATDWPEGPATALLHVFSGLDPRPFATYTTRVGAPYEPALQVGTVMLLLLAGIGAVAMSRSTARGRRTGGALEPAPAFLALAVVGTAALLAYSAAEYRFGVLLLTVAGLLVVPGVREVASWRRGGLLALALGAVAAVIGWLMLSAWVLGQSPTWQQCAS
jgi:hypothetical protein